MIEGCPTNVNQMMKGLIEMANKNCTSIPILIGIILIPQLFFWWLAPQNARAFYIAYIGMTLITAGIPVACFLTSRKSCIRRSTGLFIVGSILETIVIGATAWILAVNATKGMDKVYCRLIQLTERPNQLLRKLNAGILVPGH